MSPCKDTDVQMHRCTTWRCADVQIKACSGGCNKHSQDLGLALHKQLDEGTRRRGGVSDLVVRVLTEKVKGMGLNPTWDHIFPGKLDVS